MSSSSTTLRGQAIGLLARREHSAFELRQKLRHKGGALQDIDELIEALAAEGLQSDERFAESYVNSRARRGFGPSRIRLELQERRVDENIINLAIDAQSWGWVERAREVIGKKIGNNRPTDSAQRGKLINFLNYRGFAHEHIKAALSDEEEA